MTSRRLEQLEAIIEAVEAFRAQLVVDGQPQLADKAAVAEHELFWLYRELEDVTIT